MLEFYVAWGRGDQVWSARLASHLAGDLGIVLRCLYDPANGQLGTKRLETVLPADIRDKLRAAVRSSCGDAIPHGVLQLAALMREAMERLEAENGQTANWKLFEFMVEQIKSLVNPDGCPGVRLMDATRDEDMKVPKYPKQGTQRSTRKSWLPYQCW